MLSLSKGPMKIGLATAAAPKALATAGLSLDDEGEDEDEHHEPNKRACTPFVTEPFVDNVLRSNACQKDCTDGCQQEDRKQH
jgi:hypothetical protein